MAQVQTMKLQGKDYATVPQRLLEFRSKHPRSDVITTPTFNEDGSVVFTAKIVKDKADTNSASATGHSYGKLTGDKAFEKLETIATGRALSLLGYLNNGQVASTEEMEDFEAAQLEVVVQEIKTAKTREEFKAILDKLNPAQKREATPLINQRIKELRDAKTD